MKRIKRMGNSLHVINNIDMSWKPSYLPYDKDLETMVVLKKLAGAHRALAELKGVVTDLTKTRNIE